MFSLAPQYFPALLYRSASWRALVPLRLPIELIDDVNPDAVPALVRKWTTATMTTPPCLPSTHQRGPKLPVVLQSHPRPPHTVAPRPPRSHFPSLSCPIPLPRPHVSTSPHFPPSPPTHLTNPPFSTTTIASPSAQASTFSPSHHRSTSPQPLRTTPPPQATTFATTYFPGPSHFSFGTVTPSTAL